MAASDVVRFRRAAVALAAAGSDEAAREHAEEAARALTGLAAEHAEEELRELLRPDPDDDAVTWTVACYEIGDLAPSALRDFGDPASAVATLASCGEASHVAAELLASTPVGLTWAVLTRMGERTAFQLFGRAEGAETVAATWAPAGSDVVASASGRWEARLAAWAADPEDRGSELSSAAPEATSRGAGVARDVLRRLALLEQQVGQLREVVGRLEELAAARQEAPGLTGPWVPGPDREVAP